MSWRARLTPCINNIVIFLNPKDPNCFGVRNWWRHNLAEIKLLNPMFTLSMQELSFGEPTMEVMYNFSDNRRVRLAGCTEEEFEDIMEGIITYANNHVLNTNLNTDDGGEIDTLSRIVSFGYTESFITLLENGPNDDRITDTTFGIDDPGQEPRLFPRNDGFKYLP